MQTAGGTFFSDWCGFVSAQGAFFCRVHNVLVHNNFSKLLEEENLGQKKKPKGTAGEVIVRNLEAYINARKVRVSTGGPARPGTARAAVLSVCLLSR